MLLLLLLVAFKQILALIKIGLCAHLPLVSASTTCNGSLAVVSCCWSPTVGCACLVAEIVEIIEHQVHIFLFVLLEVVNYSLVFVNFDPDVSISLPRYSTRFHKVCTLILIQIIAVLSS